MKYNRLGLCADCLALAFSVAASAAPSILSQPLSQTNNAGSTATFVVAATNATACQWQFGTNAISGATNATLTLDDLSANQAGSYTVIVSGSGVSVTSTPPAVLTVVQGTIVQFAISGYVGGGASNLVVELFDHDKPATVQNFLHYIEAGAFTNNIFWSRCVPGFVLQGGDYLAEDRTNDAPFSEQMVYEDYTVNLNFNSPPFPFEIDNEFSVGPLIHNTFGTIAMAKQPGNPDSASDAFFFNLADNSGNLDNQDGGFTVFGRILSGTNVLDYFNGLGKLTNGIYDSGVSPFTDLPVNYKGANQPGDSNLFFVDVSFVTQPTIDTNPPTVAVTYPPIGAATTNAGLLIQGTATDDIGLARVILTLNYLGSPFTYDATGTTNWTLDVSALQPGSWVINAESQDGAGNQSTNLQVPFYVPRFPFDAYASGPGTLSTNLDGTNTTIGSTYVIKAIPLRGAEFVNWTIGSNVYLSPTARFVMQNGLQMTANFVSNTIPGGISITHPSANALLTNPAVTVAGKIAASVHSATIMCQFFSKTASNSVSAPIVVSGTGSWSLPPQQFTPGSYIVQAVARDANGRSTVTSEEFTILAPLTVLTAGSGTASIATGTYLEPGKKYTIRATPKRGQLFYQWADGTSYSSSPAHTFTMSDGLTLLETFVSNALPKSISFTHPTSSSQVLTNYVVLSGNIASSVVGPEVTCQLFTNGVALDLPQTAALSGTAWSLAVSRLPQGSYTAVAVVTDALGRQSVVSQQFTVNLFANIAGVYDGLFFGTSQINYETTGHFSLTVGRTGALSGKVSFPGQSIHLSSVLSSTGSAAFSGTGFNGSALYLGVSFDLTKGSDTVMGYVYSGGTFASNLLGYRAMTKLTSETVPAVGKYVLGLETITNQFPISPPNDGFATLAVSGGGGLQLAGTLGDNSSISESVGVSKAGVWPVFASLYHGFGMLIGWETNLPSGAVQGSLYWIKPPASGGYYSNGLVISANSTGTNYVPPVAGTSYQIVFSGGSFTSAVTNALTVKAGQFVQNGGTGEKAKISLSRAGVLTGTIADPVTGKPLSFKGAFQSPAQNGSGFILDNNGQTGSFEIGVAP